MYMIMLTGILCYLLGRMGFGKREEMDEAMYLHCIFLL